MFEISGKVQSVYTAEVVERDDEYVVEVPRREVALGDVTPGDTVQLALLTSPDTTQRTTETPNSGSADQQQQRSSTQEQELADPPVSEGETLEVTIEGVGDQGDGVAKVDRGYVLIVPGTTPGEQPIVRVETVKENVGFAEVVK
jgi:predicted RNA-binding protein with TRAM domain